MGRRSRSISVRPYSQYYTYQAYFQLFPRDAISEDECFAKSILYVTDWIRGRITPSGGEAPEFLSAYPPAADFRSFDTDDISDIDQGKDFDIRIVFDNDRRIWAMRLFELSSNSKVRGQSFVTEVTVSRAEGSVLMAIRTTCREPVRSTLAKVYRLSYIRHGLLQDDDIILTEAFTAPEYPINGRAVSVNGKSKEACEHFCSRMLANPRRQFPLVLVSDPSLCDEHMDDIDAFAWDLAGHAHVTVLSSGPNKLCYSVLSDRELGDSLKEKGLAFAVFDACPDEEGSLPEPRLFHFSDPEQELKDVFEEARDDLIGHQRGQTYDFSGTEFYSKVRISKMMALTGGGEDHYQMVLEALVSEQTEKLEAAEANEARLTIELQKEKSKNAELTKMNNKLLSDQEKAELSRSDSNSELAERLKATEEALEAEKARSRELSRPFTEDHSALLNMPLTDDRDAILKWIEDSYCGDDGCLILHDRAKDSFRRDKTGRDFRRICLMIHYLYGYTRFLNEGNDPVTANQKAASYDVLSNRFEATRSSSAEGALRNYRSDYTIDISAYDPSRKDALLDFHLKKGKGMDSDSIRIYFCYDSEIGRSIIGYMPDHLPI